MCYCCPTICPSFQFGLGLLCLFRPGDQMSLAVLSFLCSPSDGTGCLLALLAERDLTLSIVATVMGNVASLGKQNDDLDYEHGHL